jgi:hypothetical protein
VWIKVKVEMHAMTPWEDRRPWSFPVSVYAAESNSYALILSESIFIVGRKNMCLKLT